MAGRVRGGRWRWSEPRHRDRRGPPGVHDRARAEPSPPCASSTSSRPCTATSTSLRRSNSRLQQLARLEDELAPDGALPGPLVLALSSRTRIGTVERANAIAAATLPAEAQRRLTVMPVESRPAIVGPMANGRRNARSTG